MDPVLKTVNENGASTMGAESQILAFFAFHGFPLRALVNAAESHCESGGGEILEGEFQSLLVQTRRTVHVVLMTILFNVKHCKSQEQRVDFTEKKLTRVSEPENYRQNFCKKTFDGPYIRYGIVHNAVSSQPKVKKKQD